MDDEQSKFNSNLFSNGSIFIILIAIVLVIGGILILTSFADVDDHDNQDVGHVDLTPATTSAAGCVPRWLLPPAIRWPNSCRSA